MVDRRRRDEGSSIARGTTLECPVAPLATAPRYGSDVVADTLRALEIPYIALNPGALVGVRLAGRSSARSDGCAVPAERLVVAGAALAVAVVTG